MADVNTSTSIIKNKYRIVRQVGRGGMGNVYEVVHEGLGTTYALKQLLLELENNPEIASRFRHEAQMMARLQHPNIVRVFDIDSEPGFGTYLLMELIKGVDLGKVLRTQGRLSYAEVLRTGLAIASALETAHRAGLVHRDIKPANILIEEGTARAVVTDFGIAKQMGADGDENVTRTGSFIGTYRYCSPEQIRNEKGVKIDGRADVYSLGVVLYEMFSGKKFLDGMSELQIAHHVAYENDWKPPLDYPEPPPPEFTLLIDQCLARRREDRPTAAEVSKRLDQIKALGTEHDSCVARKQQFEDLGSDTDVTVATRAFATAQALRTQGHLDEAVAKYREAEAAYRQAIAEKEEAGRYRREIQNLLPEVETQMTDLRRLQQELVELNATPAAVPSIDDLEGQLAAAKPTEDAQDLEVSLANLRSLNDRLSTLRRAAVNALQQMQRDALSAWRQQCETLVARVGEFATPDHTQRFEHLARAAEESIASGDWPAVRRHLAAGRSLLAEVDKELREQARAATGSVLGKVHALLEDLGARAGGAAAPTVDRVDALEADVNRCLRDGELRTARVRADEALAAVIAAQDRAVRDEQERAGLARSNLESLLSGLDVEAARAVAPEAISATYACRTQAAEAEKRADYRVAVEAYQAAAGHCRAAREQLLQRQSARLDELQRDLRVLLERAANVPGTIAGAAIARAEPLLHRPRPLELSDVTLALAAGAEARSSLTAALEEAARFARVEEKRAAVATVQQRIANLGPSPSELRPAERLIKDAQAAATKHDWLAAEEGYTRAVEALSTLERDLHTQREKQRADGARSQLDALQAKLDLGAAARLAAEPLARAREAAARAAESEKRQDYPTATAQYEQALALFEDIAQRVAAEHAAQLAAVEQELTWLLQRAAAAPAEIVETARTRAQGLVGVSRKDDLPAAIAERVRARGDLTAALEEVAIFKETIQQQEAAEAVQRRVTELGPTHWQLRTPARLMKQAAAARGKRQWAQARDSYTQATTAFVALEQRLQVRRAAAAEPAVDLTEAATRVIAPGGHVATATSTPTWSLPSSTTIRWVGSAATVLVAAVVAVWTLKVGPFARPVAVQPPAAERPAVERPAAPAPPVERAPAPPAPVERAPVPPAPAEHAPVERAPVAVAPAAVPPAEHPAVQPAPAQGAPVEHAPAAPPAPEIAAVPPQGLPNHPPVLRSKPVARLEAPLGETVDLKVSAADEDGDHLKYTWTVDGKKAGTDSPELKVVASANHAVSLTVSDGKDNVSASWQISAIKPQPLKPQPPNLEFTPKELAQVRFNSPLRFALVVPANQRASDLKYTWSVDGKQVSDARTFQLTDYDPKMVSDRPVSVVAKATDAQGQSFAHEWNFKVLPPRPEILNVSPPPGTVEADGDRPLAFELNASPPLGNQKLNYVYEVDGKRSSVGNDGHFTFQPSDERPHELTAYVEDATYGDASQRKIKWTVQTSGIVAKVQAWLNEYERAWNAKDARKLAQLRGLEPSLIRQLEESLEDKVGLRVKFSDVKIQKVERDEAKASYRRLDEWTGAKDGRAVSRSRNVEQTFRLSAGGLTETEASTE